MSVRDEGKFAWMDSALCAQVDPELFNPAKEGSAVTVKHAKKVCSRCPVKQECLSYGLGNPGIGGVLGGTTEKERSDMRRKARRAVQRTGS